MVARPPGLVSDERCGRAGCLVRLTRHALGSATDGGPPRLRPPTAVLCERAPDSLPCIPLRGRSRARSTVRPQNRLSHQLKRGRIRTSRRTRGRKKRESHRGSRTLGSARWPAQVSSVVCTAGRVRVQCRIVARNSLARCSVPCRWHTTYLRVLGKTTHLRVHNVPDYYRTAPASALADGRILIRILRARLEAGFRKQCLALLSGENGTRNALHRAGKRSLLPSLKDVAQLNHFQPTMRAAHLAQLANIAKHCDGVRCDMAMLQLNDIFEKGWAHLLGNIPKPAKEFWDRSARSGSQPDFARRGILGHRAAAHRSGILTGLR